MDEKLREEIKDNCLNSYLNRKPGQYLERHRNRELIGEALDAYIEEFGEDEAIKRMYKNYQVRK